MSRERFVLLASDEIRPGRLPLPPIFGVKASTDDTEGKFSLLVNEGQLEIPAHIHKTFDEFIYVIDGVLGIEFDGITHRLTAGMSALLPRGVTHALRSLDQAPVRAVQLSAPGGWEKYVEDVTEANQGFDGRPDWDVINEIGARHGMHYSSSDARAETGDKSRFLVVEAGKARPGRIPVPPAFSVKVNSHDTGGAFSLLEVTLAREIPRHVHHRADEFIYVLEGELTIEFDGEPYTATSGMCVLLPHGVPHALGPGAGRPPRVLQISSPGGWESYIEDLIEAGPTVVTDGKLDPVKINPIAARYDITYEEGLKATTATTSPIR